MVQYILECIAFQLVFLIIYDFFLKRETFFQWNRLYLIGTYVLSMVLPWVKIEALKNTVPERYYSYPEYLWGANDMAFAATAESSQFTLSWQEMLLYGGMLMAILFFGYKMWQLYRLRSNGEIRHFKDFTQIVIANSNVAFSFFKSIFLGDRVLQSEHDSIIRHELVHIEQKHTWDLLFFELMRIVGWFNPLVYVYQGRVSELHEYMADAHVAKANKKEHYQQLLSQVFQTQHISFINQFFKSSLIKKRIVMLRKEKSKGIWKLKYLALVPILAGMLFYTSCEFDEMETKASVMVVDDIDNMSESQNQKLFSILKKLSDSGEHWEFLLKDEDSSIEYTRATNGSYINFEGHNEKINATMVIINQSSGIEIVGKDALGISVPFAVVEEVPVFPGCENETNARDCFRKKIQRHISKNFRYPQEAQEKGIQGRVSVMFTIQKDGNIGSVRMRGPDKALEDEAARIIAKLPRMIPGKQKGQVVRVPFSIPITFKLQGDDTKTEKSPTKFSNGTGFEDGLDIPFSVVDEVPIFPGCENEADKIACFQSMMQKHISKNFRYPKEAQEKGIQGRVSVMFTIQKDGRIGAVRMRGPDKALENEAARIIAKLPKITPGKQKGKAVRVPYSIPISFKIR